MRIFIPVWQTEQDSVKEKVSHNGFKSKEEALEYGEFIAAAGLQYKLLRVISVPANRKRLHSIHMSGSNNTRIRGGKH